MPKHQDDFIENKSLNAQQVISILVNSSQHIIGKNYYQDCEDFIIPFVV